MADDEHPVADTVDTAAQVAAGSVAPAAVTPDPPAESHASDNDHNVTRSEFQTFRDEITSKLDALASAVPATTDDVTPVKVPWTHRGGHH